VVSEQGATRRIVLAASGTAVAVALLFGYSTSTGGGRLGGGTLVAIGGSTGSTGSTGSPSTTTSTGTTTAGSTTYTGGVAQTRWGPVQVQITVSGGRVVAASAVQVPSGNGRDQMINSYAVPILNDETVQAGNAQIDTVSGATVTSDGYISSLQSALDAAHIA